MNRTVRKSKGIANGVQRHYADALRAMPDVGRVAPSIGYQCAVYAPGMGPADISKGSTSVNVGGKMRVRD